MSSLNRRPRRLQPFLASTLGIVSVLALIAASGVDAAEPSRSVLIIPDSVAKTPDAMKAYTELIEHTDATIDMVPIPGGQFLMGSPKSEKGREDCEGPQHKVKVDPFWMSKCEIPWDVFEIWMFDLDVQRRKLDGVKENARDKASAEYQESQPTEPYTDMTFGMGKRGYPAICMTQFGARTFCQWLTMKTGRYYRLPTEAEWEYACRAGTKTAYSFGDDAGKIDDYAWYYDNSDEAYHKIGQKKPNRWGLYDMHGNVAEWVLDQFIPDYYKQFAGKVAIEPLAIPIKQFPRVVRGGSWDDDADRLRSAARTPSTPDWQAQDPQIPKSIWYHTDALQVGFRIIRPLVEPTAQAKKDKWDKAQPIYDRKQGRQ